MLDGDEALGGEGVGAVDSALDGEGPFNYALVIFSRGDAS